MRAACARVSERARFVTIDSEALERYAETLPVSEVRALEGPRLPDAADPETRCAFVLTLDAVNFGSGYFPHLAKRPGHSGYRTVEASLLDRFAVAGPLSCEELGSASAESCARLFAQDLSGAPIAELMELFARAWRDLAACVGGSFADYVAHTATSAGALVKALLTMPLYRDVARYDDFSVPLLKRAQLTVADLQYALPDGPGRFPDLDELTLFADNLVPHVLRLDGVLRFDPGLVDRIERERLLAPGSREEVEIRAVAVHAVELLAERLAIPARELDYWLWNRGGGPRYKAHRRHRCRCPYY